MLVLTQATGWHADTERMCVVVRVSIEATITLSPLLAEVSRQCYLFRQSVTVDTWYIQERTHVQPILTAPKHRVVKWCGIDKRQFQETRTLLYLEQTHSALLLPTMRPLTACS